MGVLESTLDEGKTYRTFIFEEENEKRVELQVELEDLVAIFTGLRPRNMNVVHYQQIRSLLKKELKRYKKGTLTHVSKISDEAWEKQCKEIGVKRIQKGNTYVKSK